MHHILLVLALLTCAGSAARLPILVGQHGEADAISANYTSSPFRALTGLLVAYRLKAAFSPPGRGLQDAGIPRAALAGRNRLPVPGLSADSLSAAQIRRASASRPAAGASDDDDWYDQARSQPSSKRRLALHGDRRRAPGHEQARERPQKLQLGEQGEERPRKRYRKIPDPLRPIEKLPMNPETKRRKGVYGPAGERRYEELMRVNEWLRRKFLFNKMEAAETTTRLGVYNRRTVDRFLEQVDLSSNALKQLFNLTFLELGDLVRKRPTLLHYSNETYTNLTQWKALGLMDLVLAKPNAYLKYDLYHEVRPMLWLLNETVGLNPDQVQKILRNRPTILESIKTAKPMVSALKNVFAFSDEEVKAMVMKRPQLLHLNMEENVRPLVAYLSEDLRLCDEDIRDVIFKRPHVLELPVETVSQAVEAIDDIIFGHDRIKTRQLVVQDPIVLQLHPQDNVKNMHWNLCQNLWTMEEIANVVQREPSILALNYSETVKPFRNSLKQELGCNAEDVRKIMYKQPSVWGLSFSIRVAPVMEILQDMLSMSQDEVRKVVLSETSIITPQASRNGGVRARVSKLQELLDVDQKHMYKLALLQPSLLTLDVRDELIPRFEFLEAELPLSKEELRSQLVENPRVLTNSLDRMKPVLAMWKEEVERDGLDLHAEVLQCGLAVLNHAPNYVSKWVEMAHNKSIAASPVFGKLNQRNSELREWLEQPGSS
mmetsp:Transcript_92542/g.169821  ORF Transcript_92542/g.169821 Transcript_92542/m.169821 type:complete len:715 (-) Transcript_92542:24-2168(-)